VSIGSNPEEPLRVLFNNLALPVSDMHGRHTAYVMAENYQLVVTSLDSCLTDVVTSPFETGRKIVVCVLDVINSWFSYGEEVELDHGIDGYGVDEWVQGILNYMLQSDIIVGTIIHAARPFFNHYEVGDPLQSILFSIIFLDFRHHTHLRLPQNRRQMMSITEAFAMATIQCSPVTAERNPIVGLLMCLRYSTFTQEEAVYSTILPHWNGVYDGFESRVNFLTYPVRKMNMLFAFRFLKENLMQQPDNLRLQSVALMRFHSQMQLEERLDSCFNAARDCIARHLCLSDLKASVRTSKELSISDPRLFRRLNRDRSRGTLLNRSSSPAVESKVFYMGLAEGVINDHVIPMMMRIDGDPMVDRRRMIVEELTADLGLPELHETTEIINVD